jgi:hypothetical protein
MKGFMIVAVDLADGPTEGRPFVGKRLEFYNIRDRSDTLNPVVIDYGYEGRKSVMGRKEGCLPGCVLRSMWAGDSIGCGPLIPL